MISSTAPIVVVRDIICNINITEIDIVTTAACKEWQTFHSIKDPPCERFPDQCRYNFVNN